MINPRLCEKCKFAKIHQPKYDETGNKIALWSVECSACDTFSKYHIPDTLHMNDVPPQKCPFLLEHSMSMQDVSDDDKEYLSNIFTQ